MTFFNFSSQVTWVIDLEKHNWKGCSWSARFAFCLLFQCCMQQWFVSTWHNFCRSFTYSSNIPSVSSRVRCPLTLSTGCKATAESWAEKMPTGMPSMWWCKYTVEILHMEQLCHILPLCLHRLICVRWSWYQQSFVGKGQASWLRLGASWTMRTWKLQKRCTDALDLHENSDKLVLVVKGAVVEQSAFVSLGNFMASFTAQQRAHFLFEIGIKVMDALQFVFNIGCYYHIILLLW